MSITKEILKVRDIIKQSDFLIITAGAGMSVDSGLPDFRGPQGFWKAYPPMKKLGLTLPQVSNPTWFYQDPSFAWGFFGHRYSLYNNSTPHAGYNILKSWVTDKKYFIYTSNVDGHFEKAGFPEKKIVECHGTIHYLQCLHTCTHEIWPMNHIVNFDPTTFRAQEPLPICKNCGRLARPNVSMFDDDEWVADRTNEQENNLRIALNEPKSKMVVIEIGGGEALPVIREFGQNLVDRENAILIRINPDETRVVKDIAIEIHMKALDTLRMIDSVMNTD
ncbi:hypothetical protein SteCoe_38983 [Stentor coeruleus]|uniref:Deacetylase sirtuin-type domain-containing protein n=1 Tax=Stentor coeruleus TaxID=5963 RepID=A0A1R2AKZ4_9CILI|nr:hypothetical protein SteCoe_38983 [Stentor coeruleus]